MPPRKRRIEEVLVLREPTFSPEQRRQFERGIALFNDAKHWHAHEAWEAAWRLMGNESDDDAEMFLRALIQIASAIHLKRIGRYAGARNQLEKAMHKLRLAPAWFMGIDTVGARIFAEHQHRNFEKTYSFVLVFRGF